MGLFSGSKSSVTNLQETENTEIVLSDINDSISFGVISDAGAITIESVDEGLVAATASIAFEAFGIAGDAFDVAGDAFDDATDTTLSAIDLIEVGLNLLGGTVENINADSLDFALDVTDIAIFELADTVQGVNADSLDFARDTQDGFIGLASDAFIQSTDATLAAIDLAEVGINRVADGFQLINSDSLDFAQGVQGDFIDLAGDSVSVVADVALGLGDRVSDIASLAIESTEVANANVLDFALDTQGGFLGFAGGIVSRAADQVDRISESAFAEIGQTSRTLLDSINIIQARESGNTDARLADLAQTAVIGVLVAGTAITAVIFFRQR